MGNNAKNYYEKLIAILIYMTFFFSFFGSFLAYPKISFLFMYRISLAFLLFIIFIFIYYFSIDYKNLNNVTTYFAIIWISYSLLSFIWVADIKNALRDQVFLTINLIVILIFMYFAKLLKPLIIYKIVAITYSISSFVGIIEIFTDKHLWISKIPQYGLKHVPSAFFSNPNDFATYLVLFLPYIIYLFLLSKNNISKYFYVFIIFLSIINIIFTESRANYFAVVIIFLLLPFIVNNNYKKETIRFYFYFIMFIFLIVGFKLDAGLINKFIEMVTTQINSLFDFDVASMSSNVRRELLTKYGFSILIDYFLLGCGSGNSRVYMEKYKDITINTDLHNWLLDILATYGIIIFVLYFIWYLYQIIRLYKISKRLNNDLSIGAGATLISLICFIFSSISSSKMIEMRVMWLVFALSNYIISLYNHRKDAIEFGKGNDSNISSSLG
ncbi:O-antigen ligase family protein [Caldicellulosiruptoraceae bacterium PP1]